MIFTDPFPTRDSREYYLNSKNLSVEYSPYAEKGFEHTNWYEHSPAYVLYLHLTYRSLFVQLALSVITVWFLWNINKIAGWMLCFYPVHIINAGYYHKETLMIFLIVSAIYFLRDKK